MNLCIDIGNTKVKATLFNEQEICLHEVYDKLHVDSLVRLYHDYTIPYTIICSVSADATAIAVQLEKYTTLYILNSHTPLPIENNYKTPGTLGMDRIASSIGAWFLNNKNSVLSIDMGTCVTYDYIDSHHTYQGGAISPGLQMRLSAMNHFTAKLPLIESVNHAQVLGQNSAACMSSGALNGLAFELNGFIQYFYSLQNPHFQVYLTGGNSELLVNQLKSSIFAPQMHWQPHLLAIGLNYILLHQLQPR